jgi:hypothetical protein
VTSGSLTVSRRLAPRTGLWALLAAAALLGIALRIAVWRSHLGRLEADEAVVGLAAKRVLDGQFFPLFPGQQYGGMLESIVTAPLVAIFGLSLPVIRAVPFALAGVASILTWRVGRRTIGDTAAAVAGALFWIAPAYWIWMSERARGFYESSLVLELLCLLLVLRLRQGTGVRDAALLGLAAGLAWWQTPGVFAVIGPALLWLLWKRPSVWRYTAAAVPAFVLGELPWLLSNLRHHWWTFTASSGHTPYLDRVRGFNGTLPMSLDLRVPFRSTWLLTAPISGALYVALIAVCAVVAWRRRHDDTSLLPAIAIPYAFLSAISPFTWRNDEPRYVIPLMPVLALLLSAPLRTPTRAGAALAVAAGLTVFSLTRFGEEPQRDGGADQIAPLVTELQQRHITSLCSTYQLAYRVDFTTDGEVAAAECDTAHLRREGNVVAPAEEVMEATRYVDLSRRLAADRYPAWAFLVDSPDEQHARRLLERAGYARSTRGVFAVYARSRQ